MVKIRMKRFGTNNRLQWRIVVADVKMPRDGRFIEEIGYYDAVPAKEVLKVKQERLDYWLKRGAQPTQTIKALLKRARVKAGK